MKRQLNKIEKDLIIRQIKTFFLESGSDIVTVYIFGSFTESRPFSDIDIGILTGSKTVSPLDFELDMENALSNLIKIPVDIRLLNNAPLAFSQSVIRNGIVIKDTDPNLRADFESRILKEYFDFSPFQKRYLQDVENAPV